MNDGGYRGELTQEKFEELKARIRNDVRNEMRGEGIQQNSQQNVQKPVYTGAVSSYGNEMGGADEIKQRLAVYDYLKDLNLRRDEINSREFKELRTKHLANQVATLKKWRRTGF